MQSALTVRHSGFTLIELLVVMVVLAITATFVTLSISGASGYALESTAERLAATLEEARWRAISTGTRIAWEAPPAADPAGKNTTEARWFDQTQEGAWHLRVSGAGAVPFTGINVTIALPRATDGAPARLVLGPEPVGLATCVLLTQQTSTVAVVSDGVTPFAVQRDARC